MKFSNSAMSTLILGTSMMAAAALPAGGCGLLSSDLTTIKFAMPPQSYSFNTSQAGLTLPVANVPSIDCSADETICCTAISVAVPGADCTPIICDPNSHTCALTATIDAPPTAIDLKKDVPALSSFNNQSVLDITVSKITYDITENTMNVPLPAVDLFVAPNGTTSAADPAATKFGTVPVTDVGTTLTNGQVVLDPAGQSAFVNFAHHFGTPFVLLAKTTLLAPGDTPIPMGGVSFTIRGQLAAKPSL